jgi:hypothetical protein
LIRTVIKLLIALAFVNAAVRAGMTAWSHYELKDEAQQLILFGAGVPVAELSNQILEKAVELNVPLEPQNIDIDREGSRTVAYVSYTQPVEFFPTVIYPLDLSFSVEAFALNPAPANRSTP